MATIYGSDFADDTLAGTADDDSLFGLGGADLLQGQEGHDDLAGGPGNDTLDGGAGNDRFYDWQGADLMLGGDGDDLFTAYGEMYGETAPDTLDGGAGNDRFDLYLGGIEHLVIGGPGADRFGFAGPLTTASAPTQTLATFQVQDFSWSEGDRIDLLPSLQVPPGGGAGMEGVVLVGQAPAGFDALPGQSVPATPLGTSFATAWTLPFFSKTVLYVDVNRDQVVGPEDLRIAFRGGPLIDYFAFAPGSLTISGDPGDNNLFGTGYADRMVGLDGNDLINGYDGSDWLDGGNGDDRLDGGADDDWLFGGDGSDQLYGGDGHDVIETGGGGGDVIDAGPGPDDLHLNGWAAGWVVIAGGGSGADHIHLYPENGSGRVPDFEPGAGGDMIDVARLLPFGYSSLRNPFDAAEGYLRLRETFGETVLEWDPDGAAGTADGWRLALRLTATPAAALQPANFEGAAGITSLRIEPPPNSPPFVGQPVPDLTATEDQGLSWVLPLATFVDNDPGDVLSWTATRPGGAPLPAWLSFDPATHTLAGTPGNADVGVIDIELRATDRAGAYAADLFMLTVVNVNDAPVLASPLAARTIDEDQPWAWSVPAGTFVDIDAGDRLTLDLRGAGGAALPAWLHFDAAAGTLGGTPGNADVGSIGLVVGATDQAGARVEAPFTLTVRNVNDAPVAVDDTASTSRDTPVTIAVLANDNDVDLGTVLAITGFGPASAGSVTLDATGRQLVYTPLANWNGQASFVYTVGDGQGGSASARVTVNVAGSIVGTEAADTLAGTAVADSVQAKGGNDTVDGGGGNDFVDAGAGNDRASGGSGNDVLLGGGGDDVLYGNAGNDTLAGGAGNDAVYGGNSNGKGDNAADLFVYAGAPDAALNRDTFYGFEATARDRVALDPAFFGALAGGATNGIDAGEFRAGTQALDGDDRLLFDAATGRLGYDADANGPGAPVWFAGFVGLTGTLDAGDFTLGLPPGV